VGPQRGEGRPLSSCLGCVCRPMELDGPGISNLKDLGWALRLRCLWLHKTEPDRILVPDKTRALFSVAMQIELGDRRTILFWTDQWLLGQKIVDIAPRLCCNPKMKNQPMYCP
jgi:hypothetical protein